MTQIHTMNAADKRNFTQISASALVALALVAAAACGGAAAQLNMPR